MNPNDDVTNLVNLMFPANLPVNINILLLPFLSKCTISIKDYLANLLDAFKIEDSTFILSLIYIDKLCYLHNVTLSLQVFQKLFFVSLLTATKFNEDEIFKYSFYSKCAGIDLKELLYLEKRFLFLIQYSLYVGKEEYKKYVKFFKIFISLRRSQ
jgi:hypothetical protein